MSPPPRAAAPTEWLGRRTKRAGEAPEQVTPPVPLQEILDVLVLRLRRRWETRRAGGER